MKKKIMFLLLASTFFMGTGKAQKNVERFCKVNFDFRMKEGIHVTEVTIDYGILNDTAMVNNIEKVKYFDNDIRALNYMASLGWKVLSILPYRAYSFDDYACLFKQELKN